MKKLILQPEVITAGPGAGKTTEMVDRILAAIPQLNPHRTLAAITYTNSAAELIRRRVSASVCLPENLFIDTIHKFLNRFLVTPYASLYELLPQEFCVYSYDVEKQVTSAAKGLRGLSDGRRAQIRHAVVRKLLNSGLVPYDSIIELSRELMNKKIVRELLSKRIQFLFIDELQDLSLAQLDIFEGLRKEHRTAIYAVGDPEQFITGFSFAGTKKAAFDKLPFFRFRAKSKQSINNKNYRSCLEIVSFANNFHTQLQQISVRGGAASKRVFFIRKTAVDEIVSAFRKLTESLPNSEESNYLYLARENKAFSAVQDKFGITSLTGQDMRPRGIVSAIEQLIQIVIVIGRKKLYELYSLDILKYRRIAFKMLISIRSGEITDTQGFVRVLGEQIGTELTSSCANISQDIVNIHATLNSSQNIASSRHICSSINKAKGQEADSVLVLAKTAAELDNWLTTDRDIRFKAKHDEHRLGYVAFTRARDLLCLSCRVPIGLDVLSRLAPLGIEVVD